jgi:hypothetical protein
MHGVDHDRKGSTIDVFVVVLKLLFDILHTIVRLRPPPTINCIYLLPTGLPSVDAHTYTNCTLHTGCLLRVP